MRKLINLILAITLCMLWTPLVFADENRGNYIPNDESGIPDVALYEYLKIQTGKNDVYSNDFLNVTSLKLSDRIYAIKDLTGLSQLDLSSLQQLELDISTLDDLDEVLNLTSLNELVITGSSLNELPDDIKKLENLNVLEIHEAPLTTLNEGFYELSKLDTLVLDNLTILESIDPKISQMPYLESITLKGLNIEVPEEIYAINHLHTLGLVNMHLANVSEKIADLRLEYLDLSNNEFTAIPNEIYTITTLKSLNLRHNMILDISEDIEMLNNLKSLDISHNELETLPIQLLNLNSLEELAINDNKIECLDNDFEMMKLKNVIDFFDYYNIKACYVEPEVEETPVVTEKVDVVLSVLNNVVKANGVTNEDVTILASQEVKFVVDDVQINEMSTEITIQDTGKHVVSAVLDDYGTVASITFTIDRKVPTIGIQGGDKLTDEYKRDIAIESSKDVTFYVNGEEKDSGSMLLLSDNGDYEVYGVDTAGNKSNTLSFYIDREESVEATTTTRERKAVPTSFYVVFSFIVIIGGLLAWEFLKRGAELENA